jgi:hypothetical protein
MTRFEETNHQVSKHEPMIAHAATPATTAVMIIDDNVLHGAMNNKVF